MTTYLNAWSARHSPLLAMVAREGATCIDDILALLKMSRSGMPSKLHAAWPPLGPWLDCYRNPQSIGEAFMECLPSESDEITNAEWSRIYFRPMHVWKSISQEEWMVCAREMFTERNQRVALRHLKRWNDAEQSRYDAQIQGNVVSSDDDGMDWDLAMTKAPVLFFFRVFVPCLVENKIHPTLLLRRARCGDLDALEMLLHIDWSVIHEPAIASVVHDLRKAPRSAAHYRILRAIYRGPRRPTPSIKQIKVQTGALLTRIARALGSSMRASGVRDLFDAVSKDQKAGLIDLDLPPAPEALAKALQREEAQSTVMPRLDK
jgi:hypothetical protein